jgi:hypothetical protein
VATWSGRVARARPYRIDMRSPLPLQLLVLTCCGCLGASRPAAPPTTPPPVRRVAELTLGPGQARASFATAYPGDGFTVHVRSPAGTRYRVAIVAAGSALPGITAALARCSRRPVCRAGPFEALPRTWTPWRVELRKSSPPPARVAVRLRFD